MKHAFSRPSSSRPSDTGFSASVPFLPEQQPTKDVATVSHQFSQVGTQQPVSTMGPIQRMRRGSKLKIRLPGPPESDPSRRITGPPSRLPRSEDVPPPVPRPLVHRITGPPSRLPRSGDGKSSTDLAELPGPPVSLPPDLSADELPGPPPTPVRRITGPPSRLPRSEDLTGSRPVPRPLVRRITGPPSRLPRSGEGTSSADLAELPGPPPTSPRRITGPPSRLSRSEDVPPPVPRPLVRRITGPPARLPRLEELPGPPPTPPPRELSGPRPRSAPEYGAGVFAVDNPLHGVAERADDGAPASRLTQRRRALTPQAAQEIEEIFSTARTGRRIGLKELSARDDALDLAASSLGADSTAGVPNVPAAVVAGEALEDPDVLSEPSATQDALGKTAAGTELVGDVLTVGTAVRDLIKKREGLKDADAGKRALAKRNLTIAGGEAVKGTVSTVKNVTALAGATVAAPVAGVFNTGLALRDARRAKKAHDRATALRGLIDERFGDGADAAIKADKKAHSKILPSRDAPEHGYSLDEALFYAYKKNKRKRRRDVVTSVGAGLGAGAAFTAAGGALPVAAALGGASAGIALGATTNRSISFFRKKATRTFNKRELIAKTIHEKARRAEGDERDRAHALVRALVGDDERARAIVESDAGHKLIEEKLRS